METGLSTNEIINALSKSTHGKLDEYAPIVRSAAKTQSEFLAHLIAWNHIKGQVRDSKIALPVLTLSAEGFPAEFIDNSLAHLALQDPRGLLKAVRFAKQARTAVASGQRALTRLVTRYLRAREDNWGSWTRMAVQHRATTKELYALCRIKPSDTAKAILFDRKYPRGSVFESIAQLKNMSASEAAGTILNKKIPFLIAAGALGPKMKDPDIVLALINQMTPTELVTNTKMLQKLGLKATPALRGAYEVALKKAQSSKKNTLKTSRAAEALEASDIEDDLAEKLNALQEKQIKALGGVDGDWLVLADKSGSMSTAIDLARHVATTLAKFVTGRVHLVFFDTAPRYFDATGKTLEQLTALTKNIKADGGTSIGCGLLYAIEKQFNIDGIAVVSDGGERNPPTFAQFYAPLAQATGKPIPVYFYQCAGDPDYFSPLCKQAGIDLQTFDMRKSAIDYYSLPNLIQTMRVNRYSLADEVLNTPLLTQDEVFGKLFKTSEKKELVHA